MDLTKYTKGYIDRILKKKIEIIFQEKYLEDSNTSFEDIVYEYLDVNIDEIYSDITEGVDKVTIDKKQVLQICCTELLKISSEEILEAIEEPYYGLSDRERNPSLK